MRRLAVAERIAILTPFLPGERAGGVEVFCRQIQDALGPAEIFAAPEATGASSRLLARFGLLDPYRAVVGARSFLRSHAARPYDLIITNGLFGWPLRYAGPPGPVIQVYHFTLAGLAENALPLRGDRLTTARVGGWFDRASGVGRDVVAVSESVRSEVSRYYGLKSLVIPNSVDVHCFRRVDQGEAREQLGLPKDRAICLFVGRAEYAKGFDVLCDVAAAMPDTVFLSASGPAEAPPNVRFVAGVPHERMPLLYSAADVFILPSRYEGFNLSLLEALACETPAVVSRAACPFEGESDLAVLAEPLTASAFIAGIRRALQEGHPPRSREYIAERYSSGAFDRNWRDFASALLRRRNAGSLGH